MRKIGLVLAGLFLFCTAGFAQHEPISIPYDMYNGVMRVQVNVGGLTERFIFDTGGVTAISEGFRKKTGLEASGSASVTDAMSSAVSFSLVTMPEVSIGTVGLRNLSAMVLEQGDSMFECYGVVGIIGNEVFRKFNIEIDSRTKQITLLPPTTPITISMRNMAKIEPNQQGLPVITLGLGGGETIRVLFDTGSSAFLSLKDEDFHALLPSGAVVPLYKGEGKGSMGVSQKSESVERTKVEIPLITVGAAKFEGLVTEVETPPLSLLGAPLLDYGKVTLDYAKSRFYFEPFEPQIVDLFKKTWNVSMTVVDGRLSVAALWGDMIGKLQVGDEILEIDGVVMGDLNLCDVIVNGLQALKDKEKVTLLVKSGGEMKTITAVKQ